MRVIYVKPPKIYNRFDGEGKGFVYHLGEGERENIFCEEPFSGVLRKIGSSKTIYTTFE